MKAVRILMLVFIALAFASVAWAQGVINLPQSGQTICYDASGNVIACPNTGQDGDWQAGVAWPNPRFTVGIGAEVDCVTDNLTGLMWVKSPDSTMRTCVDALTYANNLTLCGYDDWRLPNVNELESLVHAGQANPAAWLNTQGFYNVQYSLLYYWSSSTYANNTEIAWGVSIGYGGMNGNLLSPPSAMSGPCVQDSRVEKN